MAKKVLNTSSGVVGLICAAFVVGVMFAGASPPAPAQGATTIEQAKAQIRASLEAGDVAAADAVLESLLALPDSAEKGRAIQQMAGLYKVHGHFEKGISLAEHVLANWPEADFAVWAQMELALCQVESGDQSAAEREIATLATDYADDPNLPWALFVIAERYDYGRTYAEARRLYEQVQLLPQAGQWAQAAALGAVQIDVSIAAQRGDWNAADRMMGKLVDTYRGSPYLAQTLFRLAEYWYETALKSEAAREEGDSRFMLEKTVELLEVITKECESSPLAVKAYLGIADCSRRLGKYEEAVDSCRQMVVRFPEAQEVCTAHIMTIQSYHDLAATGKELPQTAREHILDALAGVKTRCSGSNIARAAEQMAVALGITN